MTGRATPSAPGLSAAAQRRHSQRRQSADLPDGRPAAPGRASTPASSGPSTIPGSSPAIPTPPTSASTACASPPASTIDRLDDRRRSLDQVDRQQKQLARDLAECQRLSDQQQLAFSVLTSGKVAQAFELDREPAAVRDRYGRHCFGQSLLLARRLVQAGVPVVQANMGRVQNWDTHGNIFPPLKNACCRRWTRASRPCSTIWTRRGLLDETLVLMLGEFGRTPKVSGASGPRSLGVVLLRACSPAAACAAAR